MEIVNCAETVSDRPMAVLQCNVTSAVELQGEVLLPLNLVAGKGVSHADRQERIG